jgi:hypothetical protein
VWRSLLLLGSHVFVPVLRHSDHPAQLVCHFAALDTTSASGKVRCRSHAIHTADESGKYNAGTVVEDLLFMHP